jgi:hypothetical protein
MGNTGSTTQITANYEDIQRGLSIKNGILIHTMDDEAILISGTTSILNETQRINTLLNDREYDTNIIIYGKNTDDYESLAKKRTQLLTLGFRNVWIYPGGIFEWVLLQDVFGRTQFPTTTTVNDIIKSRPKSVIYIIETAHYPL